MSLGTLPQHRYPPGYRWPTSTLWDDVVGHAASRDRAPAVKGDDGSYTYGELVHATESLAMHYRERGVEPGSVVVVQLAPTAGFVPAFLAAERLGAIVSPVLPSLRGPSFGKLLERAAPSLVVTGNRLDRDEGASAGEVLIVGDPGDDAFGQATRGVPGASRLLPAAPGLDSICELAFTSGTTGDPKGVLHTHGTATAGILSTAQRQRYTTDDVVHVSLPVAHNFGYFYGARIALHAGAMLVLQRRWSADEMLQLSERHGVTVSSGPPAYLYDLLEMAGSWRGRLDSLRLFTCAGAKLDADLAEAAVAELPGRLSRAFGMTELGHVCSTTAASPPEKVVNTEGAPHREIQMRITGADGERLAPGSEGMISFRGPFLMAGYHGGSQEDAIDEEGFFATGDLGYADEQGYVVVTGRLKNLVIRGGENIPAETVERAIASHPGIDEAVVVAAPDARLGERPVACISGLAIDLADLSEFLDGAGVPAIHRPEAVLVLGQIPRTETGKVRRAELRKMVAAERFFGTGDDDE